MLVLDQKILSECGTRLPHPDSILRRILWMRSLKGTIKGHEPVVKFVCSVGRWKVCSFKNRPPLERCMWKSTFFIWKKYQTSDWGTNPYVNSPSYDSTVSETTILRCLENCKYGITCRQLFWPSETKTFQFSYKIPHKYGLCKYKGISNSDLTNPAIYCLAVTNNGLMSNNTRVDIVFQNRMYFTDV